LSIASYVSIGLGLCLHLFSKKYPLQSYGSIISATGAIAFSLYRLSIKFALKRVVRQQLEGDLADISKHYGLIETSAGMKMEGITPGRERSGFWVAECHIEGRNPTIIGCVGLGELSFS